jgi:hypothetical protein
LQNLWKWNETAIPFFYPVPVIFDGAVVAHPSAMPPVPLSNKRLPVPVVLLSSTLNLQKRSGCTFISTQTGCASSRILICSPPREAQILSSYQARDSI